MIGGNFILNFGRILGTKNRPGRIEDNEDDAERPCLCGYGLKRDGEILTQAVH
jgi:hypothetical protein